MRPYTQEELRLALTNAPQPLRDFAVGPTLMQIYDGLEKKHALTPTQMVAVSRVAHLSLLGLERESALETNLHQALPLLPHTVTVELVADITTRILKEGRRRVDENILEPSVFSAIPEPDPRLAEYDRINNLDDEDPEKKAFLEKLKAEEEADRLAFEEKRRKEEEAKKNAPPEKEEPLYVDSNLSEEDEEEDEAPVKSSYEKELEAIDKEFAEKEAAEKAAEAAPAGAPPSKPVVVGVLSQTETLPATPPPPKGPSISSTKLAAPTVSVKNEVENMPLQVTEATPAQPAAPVPKPTPPQPTAPQGKSQDPYREPLD